MAELEQASGQAEADPTGTTVDAPVSEGEQSVNSTQTTSGPDHADSFYDPNDIPDELKPAYKQMQAAFTKKMQGLSDNRHKIDAYDAFERDPTGTLQRLAQQYGVQIQQDNKPWEPQDWDDVTQKLTQDVLRQLQPVLTEVNNVKKSNMEMYMDNNFPDWRQYEEPMINLLNQHPTLAKDPDKLYEMSIPPEVRKARAMKEALAKVNGQKTQVSEGSRTTKTPSNIPKGAKNFDEAVKIAKAKLAEQGVRP